MSSLWTSFGSVAVNWERVGLCMCVCVCGTRRDRRESVGSECVGRWCNVIAHPPAVRRSNEPVPCVSGVLSQHVAACWVETTLRGWWAPPIELAGWAGGGSVRWRGWVSEWVSEWVGGVVVAMVIRAFLFAPLFARSPGGTSSSITATVVEVFVCVRVCVCVRAFVCSCVRSPPSLPPYTCISIYLSIYLYIFIFQ